MRPNFIKRIAVSATVFTGIAVAVSIIPFRAQADQWDKMTLLTVDQPIQVSNTYLEPGTYMFKLADSQSDRHIVQIFTKDRKRLINTIIAIPSYRVEATGRTQFTFWETPPGFAKAIRMWYYPGHNFGQEFRYPTELRQLVAVATAPAPAPPPQVSEQAPPAEQSQAEITQNTQETVTQETAPQAEQPPVEIAQNTPPANNVAPQPPSQPEPPQTLPKTASPYPLFGLGGLFALGLYTVLRIRTVS